MVDTKEGVRYIVTKQGDDGTFIVGDHIERYKDGDIFCVEAGGWVSAEDAEKALTGVEVIVDKEWVEDVKSRLKARLSVLDSCD